MVRILWLNSARNDMRDIKRYYLNLAGYAVAKRLIKKITDAVSLLRGNPLLGRKDDSFAFVREYRYIIVGYYKIYYFEYSGSIYIVAIWDTRQEPSKLKL